MDDYLKNGFAVVRNVFSGEEISEIAEEVDRLKLEGLKHTSSFRQGNILFAIEDDPNLGHVLRFLHWPGYISPVLARYRIDIRLLEIVMPYIGINLKQISSQIVWKTPGAKSTSYTFHQDYRFRRPRHAYRRMGISNIQIGIAIDGHCVENGCLKMVKGSHLEGPVELNYDKSVYKGACSSEDLDKLGYSQKDIVDVELDPGDVVYWSPYTIHGSGNNLSNGDRRLFINGFITAENCDVGEWAFKDGKPCELGEQQMVQYEDLYERPEPHYVEGDLNPYKEDNY